MKKLAVSLFFILALLISSFAQEKENEVLPNILISDVFISSGFYIENTIPANLADFNKLAPNSSLLPQDFEGFSYSDWSNSGGNMFISALGLSFKKKDGSGYRSNPLLRVGIRYHNSNTFYANFKKTSSSRFDTMSSASTGEIAYLDSVKSSTYNLDYTASHLQLNFSLIFRTNPEKRWSLFGGFGISGGLLYNAQTSISSFQEQYVQFEYQEITISQKTLHYSNHNYKKELHRNRSSFGGSIFAPFGVDFRIGNKAGFLNKIHLFYEIQPSLNIVNVPELETIITGGMNQGIGIKIHL